MEALFRALVVAARQSSFAVLSVLDRAIRAADPVLDATLFFAARDGYLTCEYANGARAEHFRALRLPTDGASLPARAVAVADRVVLARDNRCVMPSDRAALAVPMISERHVRGVWYAASARAQRLNAEEQIARLVDCATEPYVLALEREADRADAAIDMLTGILAPRAFRRRLHELVAASHAGILSLWFVDTDRFKSVNDKYGHAAGDRVLQQMAALLEDYAVPEADLIGRKGGDEFCMLVRGCAKMRAIERAALCRAVRAHDFSVPLRVTTSVGVAAYPFDGRDAPELLEAADAAMYFAKRCGRDRIGYALEGNGFALYE